MTDPDWRERYRNCPTSCPWVPHPENADFQRCDVQWCRIVRPNPNRRNVA
jgi:hypothetical protein